jgi:hypothetical protein
MTASVQGYKISATTELTISAQLEADALSASRDQTAGRYLEVCFTLQTMEI